MNVSPGVDRYVAGLHIGVHDRSGHRPRAPRPAADSAAARWHRPCSWRVRRACWVICERMLLIRFSGSTTPIGAARLTPANRFPPAGIVVGTHVDRDRHRQRVDRHAHVLVIQPKRATQTGQVRVVDRSTRGLGGPVQVAERDVDGVAARRQAAPPQQRRRVRRPAPSPGRSTSRSRRRRSPTTPGRGPLARPRARRRPSAPRTLPAIGAGQSVEALPASGRWATGLAESASGERRPAVGSRSRS